MSSLTINTRVVLRKKKNAFIYIHRWQLKFCSFRTQFFFPHCCITTLPTMPRNRQQQGSVTDGERHSCCQLAVSRSLWFSRYSRIITADVCEVMAGETQQLSESRVIRSLRRFRDTYFPNSGKVVRDLTPLADRGEEPQPGFLDILPVRQMLVTHVFHLFKCPKKKMYSAKVFF